MLIICTPVHLDRRKAINTHEEMNAQEGVYVIGTIYVYKYIIYIYPLRYEYEFNTV